MILQTRNGKEAYNHLDKIQYFYNDSKIYFSNRTINLDISIFGLLRMETQFCLTKREVCYTSREGFTDLPKEIGTRSSITVRSPLLLISKLYSLSYPKHLVIFNLTDASTALLRKRFPLIICFMAWITCVFLRL